MSKKLFDSSSKGLSDLDSLSTDYQNLFALLTLIVDIHYRDRYGTSLEEEVTKSYNEGTIYKKVVADHIPPVDDGLLRH